jgi:hypothetical protein
MGHILLLISEFFLLLDFKHYLNHDLIYMDCSNFSFWGRFVRFVWPLEGFFYLSSFPVSLWETAGLQAGVCF